MSKVNTRIPLQGGYANEIWKVRHDNHWLIEKNYRIPVGTPNPMYPNLPDHEARVLAHLSGTGIAPEFVSYTAARGRSGSEFRSSSAAGVGTRRAFPPRSRPRCRAAPDPARRDPGVRRAPQPGLARQSDRWQGHDE